MFESGAKTFLHSKTALVGNVLGMGGSGLMAISPVPLMGAERGLAEKMFIAGSVALAIGVRCMLRTVSIENTYTDDDPYDDDDPDDDEPNDRDPVVDPGSNVIEGAYFLPSEYCPDEEQAA